MRAYFNVSSDTQNCALAHTTVIPRFGGRGGRRSGFQLGHGPGARPRLGVVGDGGETPATSTAAADLPSCSKAARIAAATSSVTTNITKHGVRRQQATHKARNVPNLHIFRTDDVPRLRIIPRGRKD